MSYTKKLRFKKVKFSNKSDSQRKPGFLQRLSLSRQLYLGVLIIAMISVVLTAYFVGIFYWSTYIQQLNENQSLKLCLVANDLNGWINNHLEALRFNARLDAEKKYSLEEHIALSNALLNKYVAFHRITAYSTDMVPLYGVKQFEQDTLRIVLNKAAFDNAVINKEEYIGRVLFDSNNPMLSVYVPVLNEHGDTVIVLSALINLRYMSYSISSIQLEQYGYAYVIDERNNILSSNFAASGYSGSDRFKHDYFFFLNNVSPRKYKGIDNKQMISNFRDIKAPQWFLVIEYPISMILRKIDKNLGFMLLSLIASLSFGILGARIVSQNMKKPLKLLTDSAQQISQGIYQIKLQVDSINELGLLSTAFNTMSQKLEESFLDIQKQLEYEKMISEISSLFINLESSNLIQLQSMACMIVGEYSKAKTVLLYLLDPNMKVYTMTNYWTAIPKSTTGAQLPSELKKQLVSCMFHSQNKKALFILNSHDIVGRIQTGSSSDDQAENCYELLEQNRAFFEPFFLNNTQYLIASPFSEQGELFGFQMLLFDEPYQNSVESEERKYTNLASLVGTFILKTHRRQTLRETSEKLSITLQSIAEGVISTNVEGYVTLINSKAEEILGLSAKQVQGMKIDDVFRLENYSTKQSLGSVEEMERISPKILNHKLKPYLTNSEGAKIPIEASFATITDSESNRQGMVIVFRDITNKLKAEAERMKIEKFEAFGYIAAGMAHDFNNLLSSILGSVSMAQLSSDPDSEVASMLSETETIILQGKDITSRLLTLERDSEPNLGRSVLLSKLESIVKIVLFKTSVKVTYNLSENLPAVKMQDGTITQIMTNILINAAQAMSEKGEIVIHTSLGIVESDTELPMDPGKYVILKVIDNGPGISEDDLSKIFIPYYTTKENGTGLGIPTVFSLMSNHGGYMKISSEVGIGTEVVLYFPVCE